MTKFKGFLRTDGSVGIRNNILIIAVDECMDGIARSIATSSEECIVITNHYTCMLGGQEETLNMLMEMSCHPNVYGVIVLAMGCGSIDPERISTYARSKGRMAFSLTSIKEKGTVASIKRGKSYLSDILKEASKIEATLHSISKLRIGIKCGGSDTSSGMASNPSVGHAVDLLIDQGATCIAGELLELVGCEKELQKRVVNSEVSEKLIRLMSEEENRWSIGGNTEFMSVGNSVGGLTTIEEKALGSLSKIGTKAIQGVLEFSQVGHEIPDVNGLYLSDVTMLCGGSATHFATLGVHIILWTSGGAGFNSQLVPVIRVSGNRELINDDIDIDACGIIEGTHTIKQVGEKILDEVHQVANGKQTSIESLGYSYATLYQKDVRLEHCMKGMLSCSD